MAPAAGPISPPAQTSLIRSSSLVEPAAATAQVDATRLVVILPRAKANTKREAPTGEGVEAEGLLCQLSRVRAKRAKQDRRLRAQSSQ